MTAPSYPLEQADPTIHLRDDWDDRSARGQPAGGTDDMEDPRPSARSPVLWVFDVIAGALLIIVLAFSLPFGLADRLTGDGRVILGLVMLAGSALVGANLFFLRRMR
jgi:hypothetical protein